MNAIRKIDEQFILLHQEVYLWLLDTSGIYLATVAMILQLLDHAMRANGFNPFSCTVLALFGIRNGLIYYAQYKNNLKIVNIIAQSWQDAVIMRTMMWVIFLFIFITDTYSKNFWNMLADIAFLCWWYSMCVKVREREPKDWFKSWKMVGANT